MVLSRLDLVQQGKVLSIQSFQFLESHSLAKDLNNLSIKKLHVLLFNLKLDFILSEPELGDVSLMLDPDCQFILFIE